MKKIGVGILFLILIATIKIASFFVLQKYNYIRHYYYDAPIPSIINKYLDDEDYINISYDIEEYKIRNKIYYLYKNDDIKPSINDNWILGNNSKMFKFKLDNNIYNAYLKNEDNDIISIDGINKIGKVTNMTISKDKIYLPINGKYKVSADYDKIVKLSSDILSKPISETRLKAKNPYGDGKTSIKIEKIIRNA